MTAPDDKRNPFIERLNNLTEEEKKAFDALGELDWLDELARAAFDAGDPLLRDGTHTSMQAWIVAIQAAVTLDRKRQREKLAERVENAMTEWQAATGQAPDELDIGVCVGHHSAYRSTLQYLRDEGDLCMPTHLRKDEP